MTYGLYYLKQVTKYSKSINLQVLKINNYRLKSAKVNFIVYWLKEGAEQEVKIVLPELYFEKQHDETMN